MYAQIAHVANRDVHIFHARWVILTMSVYSFVIHERMAGNWDAQSYDQNQNTIMKQNSPGLLLVWTVLRCFGWPWSVLVGGGGV